MTAKFLTKKEINVKICDYLKEHNCKYHKDKDFTPYNIKRIMKMEDEF